MDTTRKMQIDNQGNLRSAKETSQTQLTRLEYKYDAQGNWTERLVWSRLEPNPHFQRSNVERRQFTYYLYPSAVFTTCRSEEVGAHNLQWDARNVFWMNLSNVMRYSH